MHAHTIATAACACIALALACASALAQAPGPLERKPAEPSVQSAHARARATLPMADRADFDDAERGFIATLPEATIAGPKGEAWSMREYAFLRADESPATVNPGLWRMAQLNLRHGLFKVTERLYQVRGFDISNMTIVEGDTGLIVIDPLTTVETARAALELYHAHRPLRPVVAVIYTHSHADHFGGVRGVTNDADVAAGRTIVLAPQGFMKHAVSENVIAGTAMSRRAAYQFGTILDKGPRAQVDAGLGKTIPSGTISLIAPTEEIVQATDERSVDGVRIVFHQAPGTEAPAEMHLFFPQLGVLNMAENVTHTLHNLLPLRGAEVRDALGWSRYVDEALRAYGGRADVLVAQHHWPTFGRERVAAMLARHRDLYKYLHDQTLRLLNLGYTGPEIAEVLVLPDSLAADWSVRDFYGTLRHNVKAIYQRYLGWYDGNPSQLDPLPPVQAARKSIEYMGGAAQVIRRAREDFEKGNFRWVAQVMNQVVFADPANREARALEADALEQLGYLAESGTWRNAYLLGAQELRHGMPPSTGASTLGPDLLQALPIEMYFDLMGVRLNAQRAQGKRILINWNFTDLRRQYVLNLENSALTWRADAQSPDANATLTLERTTLDAIILKQTTFLRAIAQSRITLQGNPFQLNQLMGLLDDFPGRFEIVEPRPGQDGLPPH